MEKAADVLMGCFRVCASDKYVLWHNTVKPVLCGHSKIDKTKILMTNFSLMMAESIAECSLLQYF